jgi:uncharacterized protein with PIN domain
MRFICDNTLGKLTKYLRILGFDTISLHGPDRLNEYRNLDAPPLFFTKRTKYTLYEPTVFIRANRIEEQLKEIGDIIMPHINGRMFMTRCVECNSLLESVPKEEIESRVPEYIYHHHEKFRVCPSCNKIYWEGTHIEHIKERIGTLKFGKAVR